MKPDLDTAPNSILPAGTTLTPMLSQYMQVKQEYADAIVFYRLGDFYEMFFDDAIKAAPILEVQLTSRDKNAEHPIPMCGIPYHAATGYVQKLLNKGLKVAICEQVEDPKLTKGIVKRSVVRVITPALIGDPSLVAEDTSNYLLALKPVTEAGLEAVLLDLLGGQIRVGRIEGSKALSDLLFKYLPKEILLPRSLGSVEWFRNCLKIFPLTTLSFRQSYFYEEDGKELQTIDALKTYLKETQKLDSLPFLGTPTELFDKETMALDATTLRSLEVLRGLHDEEAPSLYRVVDHCHTPMGRRTLKEWLSRPSIDIKLIKSRHEAVGTLLSTPSLRDLLSGPLKEIRDLERLTTKTALGLAMPRDLVGIREILKQIPWLKKTLKTAETKLLKAYAEQLNPLKDLCEELEKALEDSPAATLRDGGIFKDSYSPEITELRGLSKDAKSTIAAIEARERARTKISSLKIKYSKVFGYTIEITNSHLTKVPEEYIRKQTISNGERFITEELKNFEEKVITSDAKLKTLEESLFLALRKQVARESVTLLKNARAIAEIDVLLSFAVISEKRGYVLPQMTTEGTLELVEGRHPVIETLLAPGNFVPNSISFSEELCRTLIITGPNMAGKSTIMRQVALIVLLAHAGCYIPAQSGVIPITDAIYTRIGSSDDLSSGRSTFMVEMTETARILETATPQSLILIDEIGRGTSTYDGLSLAWSLVEYIHTQVRAKTLFATHFHELTSLEKSLPQLQNANILVEKWNNEIVFLHKLKKGTCHQSYGIEVAKLAHLPSKVLTRAKEILGVLESQSQQANRGRYRALDLGTKQLGFFEDPQPLESRTSIDA